MVNKASLQELESRVESLERQIEAMTEALWPGAVERSRVMAFAELLFDEAIATADSPEEAEKYRRVRRRFNGRMEMLLSERTEVPSGWKNILAQAFAEEGYR